MNVNYKTYITGIEWRNKHKEFRKRSRNRCAFSFLSTKKRYNVHHMNYDNLGDEQLWIDVVVVHPWIHQWILHGILSGFKRPSQQKSYPNVFQKTAHFWCCQPVMVRGILAIALIVNLVKTVI